MGEIRLRGESRERGEEKVDGNQVRGRKNGAKVVSVR